MIVNCFLCGKTLKKKEIKIHIGFIPVVIWIFPYAQGKKWKKKDNRKLPVCKKCLIQSLIKGEEENIIK